MQESVDVYDGCDKGTFCCALVDWMIKQLGYALPSMGFPVYWLDPGKTVVDGLGDELRNACIIYGRFSLCKRWPQDACVD